MMSYSSPSPMDLSNNQKYVAIAAVVIIIVAAACGAYFLTKDSGDGTDVKGMANDIAEEYKGAFGPFTVDSTSTSDKAALVKENDSSRQKYSYINITASDDVKKDFSDLKTKIASVEGFMGGKIAEVKGISGFDDVAVYKMDIRMGTMTAFTMLYFVGYSGDVLVESYENPLYHPGTLATDDEISEIMKVISGAISA